MMRFSGKTAVVTGAARGIGAATAARFLSEGAHVVAIDKQPIPVDKLSPSDIRHITALTLDLSDLEAVVAAVAAATQARNGPIDFLINNAGIGGGKAIFDTTDSDWDRFIQTNLTSVFRVCRECLPHMRRPGGRIVNISSVFGLTGFPGSLAYSVAKAGVAQLTRQLAVDLAPEKILVNAIAPGIIETAMTDRRLREDDWYKVVMCDATPIGRNGRPEDIAGVAAFLCSQDAAFIAGQVLVVDGGWLESKYLPRTLSERQ